jgi:c-di-GMP-binding flagellar brake protein YcgR
MELEEKAESVAAQPVEHRRRPRHAVDQEASLLVVSRNAPVQCRVVDLSDGGCKVRTRERFPAPIHARVEVSFKVNGIAFRLSGVVQWTDGRNQAGLRFGAMSSRRLQELAEVLGEVEAERAKAVREAAEKLAAEVLAAEVLAAEKLAAEKLAADKLAAERLAGQLAAAEMLDAMRRAAERIASEQAEDQGRQQAEALAMAKEPVVLPKQAEQPAIAEQPGALPRPTGGGTASVPHAKPTKRERRSQLRHDLDDSAQILLINVRSALHGRIVNLSLGGCRIRTHERFPVGIYTRVETEFNVQGLPFRIGGVTQAIYDRNTVGIRFLDVSDRKREQLQQLIEEIEESRQEDRPDD